MQDLLKAAEELDELKTEGKIVGQPKQDSSSLECAICFGSLLKGTDNAPYPPVDLQGGAYGQPYVVVCHNGHLFHKECIKQHINNPELDGTKCPECRQTMIRDLKLSLYPKSDTNRVQRDLFKYVKEKKPEAVQYLLAVGANPNAFLQTAGAVGMRCSGGLGRAPGRGPSAARRPADQPAAHGPLHGAARRRDCRGDAGRGRPVYKLLAQELAKVERGERAEGEPAPGPEPEPVQDEDRPTASLRPMPDLEDEDRRTASLRPLRPVSDEEEELRRPAPNTLPVVEQIMWYWWNTQSYTGEVRRRTGLWANSIAAGITDFSDLRTLATNIGRVIEEEEGVESRNIYLLRCQAGDYCGSSGHREYEAVMVHLTGNPGGTEPDGARSSYEERAEIVEWLMRGLDEVAVQLTRDSFEQSAGNDRRRYEQLMARLVTITNQLQEERANARTAQYRDLAAE